MALRGIQEYIARDANNIARAEKEPSNIMIIIHIGLCVYSYRTLCVILLSYDREWLPAAILSVNKQHEYAHA